MKKEWTGGNSSNYLPNITSYTLDAAADVPSLVKTRSGPQATIGR